MKRLNLLLFLALAVAVVIVFTSCAASAPDRQSFTQKNTAVSEQYLDFYDEVSVVIEKVNTQENTAIVTATIPDLEMYLQKAEAFEGHGQTVELEFPVQQIDGEWQIVSMEPLTEYIRNESTRILVDMMENSGGVIIDFDPQGVKE